PSGEARLIQDSISVRSVKSPAIVESTDPATRTIVFSPTPARQHRYTVASSVGNFGEIRTGDRVQANVSEKLAVYVLRDGKVPVPSGTPESVMSDAKVLMVDPSYRLLTVQYPSGATDTFKVPLGVRLTEMEAGNDVVIQPLEAVGL